MVNSLSTPPDAQTRRRERRDQAQPDRPRHPFGLRFLHRLRGAETEAEGGRADPARAGNSHLQESWRIPP